MVFRACPPFWILVEVLTFFTLPPAFYLFPWPPARLLLFLSMGSFAEERKPKRRSDAQRQEIWFVFSSMRFASSRKGGSFQSHALVWFARFTIPKTAELLVAYGYFLAVSLCAKIETIKSFDARCHKRKTEKSSRILHGYSK